MRTAELLSPEGAKLSDPGQVERALAEMWKQSGKAASGEAQQPAATRVCVANLVVVAAAEQWNELLGVLGELSPMYPTRTIALLLSEDGASCQTSGGGAAESVRASVSALCHVPQPGQPQVCCEQILLHATHAQSGDLHRTILPLLEADVPVMVWWTLDPRHCTSLLDALAQEAKRFILDAGVTGLSLLPRLTEGAGKGGLTLPGVREIGWYRIHRWRELIASMFDECGGGPLAQVDELRVDVSDRRDVMRAAIWLIAFLGGQLDWELVSTSPGAGEVAVAFKFRSGGREVRASVQETAGAGLVGLAIRSGTSTFEARRGQEELRIIVHEEHVCRTPRVVHLPRRRRSEALAAALAGRAIDAAFTRAARLAAQMAAAL